MNEIDTAALSGTALDDRERLIKDILARGEIAVFTNIITGKVKKVDKWEPDDMNDLTAFWHTPGTVPYVCWNALEYRVTAEKPDTMQNNSQRPDNEQ